MPDAGLATDFPRGPICGCGATELHPRDPRRCKSGHQLAGHHGIAFKHGASRFKQQGDASLTTEQVEVRSSFVAQVIVDKGGEAQLTAIERARIKRLGELDVVASLIAADLARRGLLTPRGRIRGAVDKWLTTLTVFDRYCERVGAERRPKSVESLSEYLRRGSREAS
jgi:hypothetical protein